MGGEGAMMAMAAALKNNKSQLSKKKERGGLEGSYANVKMKEFPKATPDVLEAIKLKTIEENKRIRIKQLVLGVVFVLIVFLAMIYVFNI